MLDLLFFYFSFRRFVGFFLISFWVIFCIFGIFRLLDNPRPEEVDFFREFWKYPALSAMFGLILFITGAPQSKESSIDDGITPQHTSSEREGRSEEKGDDGPNWWEFGSEPL